MLLDDGFLESKFSNTFESIGCPLPLDEHGVSVSLPTWADVVGYEEGIPKVSNQMKIGYPRFKIHDSVSFLNRFLAMRLAERYSPIGHTALSWMGSISDSPGSGHTLFSWRGITTDVMTFPTQAVAERFKSFMEDRSSNFVTDPICTVILKRLLSTGALTDISSTSIASSPVPAEPDGSTDDFTVAVFPAKLFPKAKAFWQHCGEILSSRQAARILHGFLQTSPQPILSYYSQGHRLKLKAHHESAQSQPENPEEIIRNRIASIVQEPASAITIAVSGMAAIFTSFRLAKMIRGNDAHFVVFGFPYLDTLKLLQRKEVNPAGVTFLGHGDGNDMDRLQGLLESLRADGKSLAAVITECPSNPLLKVPPLVKLTALAKEYGFLLIVDDTVSGFANIDVLHKTDVNVDILVSSLTKAFSGVGNVLAGSLIINSLGRYADQLKAAIPTLSLPRVDHEDLLELEFNSRDYGARCAKIGKSALEVATWLSQQPEVEKIYYPGLLSQSGNESQAAAVDDDRSRYTHVARSLHSDRAALAFKRAANNTNRQSVSSVDSLPSDEQPEWSWTGVEGDSHIQVEDVQSFGCLVSIVLKPQYDEKIFYDALLIAKGPSLGTNFTLCCPYTLLAHYSELPWAAQYGVSHRLIRVSVGLEDMQILKEKFSSALRVTRQAWLWRLLRSAIRPGKARQQVISYLFH